MRRHWLQRVSATLFAIWFAIVGFEPGALGALGACPTYQSAAGIFADVGASVGHAAHTAGHTAAHEHHSAPAKQHAHHCTCPGSCCATAVAVPATAAHVARVGEFTTTYIAPELSLRAAWTDFVLPFATAPPSDALA